MMINSPQKNRESIATKSESKSMKKLDTASAALVLIGAVNLGFFGLFEVNLIHFFVENTTADRFIYAVIGIAAIYRMIYWRSIRSRWKI